MTNRVMVLKLRAQLLGLCLAGLCLGTGAEKAHSYDPTARISLAGNLGLAAPAMSDVNDRIRIGNVYMAERNWIPLGEISSLFSMGYDIRADLFGNWMLSVGGGRIFGSQGVNFDQVIDVEPSANILQALAVYRLPWRPSEAVRMAVGAGYVRTISASLKVRHEHRNVEAGTERIEELDVGLSANGALGFLETEFVLTERFTLSLDAGYRFLNATQESDTWSISRLGTDELRDSDGDGIQDFEDLSDRSYIRRSFLSDDQLNSEGRLSELDPAAFDVDFSGPTLNVSLRVYLF